MPTEFTGCNLQLEATQKDTTAHKMWKKEIFTQHTSELEEKDGKILVLSSTLWWSFPSDYVLLPKIMFKTLHYWLMFLSQSVHICFFTASLYLSSQSLLSGSRCFQRCKRNSGLVWSFFLEMKRNLRAKPVYIYSSTPVFCNIDTRHKYRKIM